ncbi:hypothetical protein RINTHH_15570 [Richelia intracellularis HH01]|uniref:Uncharacterized protein n=1 Tax=Richelia intracellularis HH01 TaxID=1165094 RepID=M1WZM8_9NOST|nr:hypothetical protein RINTHH_15570 [Richelia intracellularis HH01]
MEERVIYQSESNLCGTYLSYSIILKGWLSPLIWSFSHPYTDGEARS